ncbi:hypothetical protein [Olleya sp. HaHaR_3_96]|uniref:hypothetical protein n=1 Tax=Olleya sp. HaHaR_3_96 TaxID=2745560 RepID=UPI001C4FE536|nr:hypothetical protein [Olleya sp. HaHaR_3_96]QXP58954.1 hypothetical protein H0I26_13655 [Olleya sp. HaHaR_3_96]
MDKKQHKYKNLKSRNQVTSNRGYVFGLAVAVFIALTPYLYSLYESVPETKVWRTLLFEYNSNHYEDANLAMWVLTGKLLPLILLLLWFFTCRHWWYHALLVPIIMYSYQIIVFFNDELTYIDELQLIYLLPFMAIIIPSIYLVRARIFNRLNSVDQSIQDLEDELTFKPKTIKEKIRQYF